MNIIKRTQYHKNSNRTIVSEKHSRYGCLTLDSNYRGKHIANNATISHKNHNDRAIYIAQKKGLIHGFNGNSSTYGLKVNLNILLDESL